MSKKLGGSFLLPLRNPMHGRVVLWNLHSHLYFQQNKILLLAWVPSPRVWGYNPKLLWPGLPMSICGSWDLQTTVIEWMSVTSCRTLEDFFMPCLPPIKQSYTRNFPKPSSNDKIGAIVWWCHNSDSHCNSSTWFPIDQQPIHQYSKPHPLTRCTSIRESRGRNTNTHSLQLELMLPCGDLNFSLAPWVQPPWAPKSPLLSSSAYGWTVIDGLSENDLHGLMCLNTWSPIGGCLGRIRGCSFAWGSLSPWASFEVSKDRCHSALALSFSYLWAKLWALNSSWHPGLLTMKP